MKSTPTPAHCGAVELKLDAGVSLILIFCTIVSGHVPSVTTNVIDLVPDAAYVAVGFCCVELPGVAPLPKSQKKVTPLEVPVFVKSTVAPVHCGAVEVKSAFAINTSRPTDVVGSVEMKVSTNDDPSLP